MTLDILLLGLIIIIFGTIFLITPRKLSESIVVSNLPNVNNANASSLNNSNNNLKNKEIIGFLPSWIVSQNTKVNISELSQLIYFGFGVNKNGNIVRYGEDNLPVLEWHYFTSAQFQDLKNKAKKSGTKVLIAFKMFHNEDLDNLISNVSSTNFFIKNTLDLLRKYDLDGINLDIEYFTDSDFPTSKYLNIFLDKVAKALKANNPQYLISVDVNATVILNDKAYDMVKIGEIVDRVILMAYDYSIATSLRAGPVAPINAPVNAHSISESINSVIGRVPLEKLILGIPLYGYEWQTLNTNHKSTAIFGSGALATYKRVMDLIANRNDVVKHWDEEAESPWLTYTQSAAVKQIYYENERSLRAKVKFVNSKNLGGVALWALGYEGKYEDIWNIFRKFN